MRKFSAWPLLAALGLTLLLAATINGDGIWTDEAFSAFLASHRTLTSLWSTLRAGDSSDLQMALYYIYLFFWCKLFGLSEVAFRTANIPFGLLFSGTLVWAGQQFFRSRGRWLVAGLSPLLWSFSNDARPYFAIAAFSTVCVACLLVYLESSAAAEKRGLLFAVLASLLVGAAFHMLMLLLVGPLCVVLLVFWQADHATLRWSDWKLPLALFTPLAAAEAVFFAWTFGRGASYEYGHPDLLSMASVLFRFAGLSGYYPNRRYDIPFQAYLPAMAAASLVFAVAMIALLIAARRSSHRLSFFALSCGLATGIVQAFVLSLAVKQQVEARHLASLLPLLLFLPIVGLSSRAEESWRSPAWLSSVLLVCLWLLSDLRLTFLPEYKREDFKGAVVQALAVSNGQPADVVVVADPIAPSYYGLQAEGPPPCFPLADSCSEAFSKVPWEVKRAAVYGAFWTPAQVTEWLRAHAGHRRPGVILISRSRHPMYKNSPWWEQLRYAQYSRLYFFHGFYVYVFS